jgi:hypothetical protein
VALKIGDIFLLDIILAEVRELIAVRFDWKLCVGGNVGGNVGGSVGGKFPTDQRECAN